MNLRLRATRLLLLPVAFLALTSHHVYQEGTWDTLLGLAGLVLLLVAMGGRIWASAHLAGRKNRTLVTTGPFALVRNPLYISSLIGFVGAGLAFESIVLAATFAGVFFATHWPAILREERRLAGLFGEDFDHYRRSVPRFIPKLGPMRGGGVIPLDPIHFRIALRDCLAIPFVFVVADALEWAKLAGILPVLVHLP
jgi:protein-S-isoprenylcysteine O-methyltransferase Ste14